MKSKLTFVALLGVMLLAGLPHRSEAIAPSTLNYQGRLINVWDVALNGVFSIQFKLWTDSVGGFDAWTESQLVTVTNGLFSVTLGLNDPIPNTTFLDPTVYLGITVGSDPEMTPRTLITSSAYSQQVGTIHDAVGGTISSAVGIDGYLLVSGPSPYCIQGMSTFLGGTGVRGEYVAGGPVDGIGVGGYSAPLDNYGIGGYFEGGYIGARGIVNGVGTAPYIGILGESFVSGAGSSHGLYGTASTGAFGTAYGVFGRVDGSGTKYAGYFLGDVSVLGFLSKLGGGFRIDHPLDPANKYLQHSFVESPDMKNFYDGTTTLDGRGEAIVNLPEWFDNVNKDFRYQLTAIGSPAPGLHVAREIEANQFVIAGGTPNQKISWAVTGIRKDVWAEENRMPVELTKPTPEMGKYLYPNGFGRSDSERIGALSEEVKAKDEAIRKASEAHRATIQK